MEISLQTFSFIIGMCIVFLISGTICIYCFCCGGADYYYIEEDDRNNRL